MSDGDLRDRSVLTCEEVTELAGLHVLHALDAEESAAVRVHLDGCAAAHPEFEELGGVVPAIAQLFEPVDAPPELKSRVMAAVAAAGAPVSPVAATAAPPTVAASVAPGAASAAPSRSQAEMDARVWEPPARERLQPRRVNGLGWAMTAAAVMVIAVLGAWNVVLQSRAGEVDQRTQLIAQAIAASTDPEAEVAVLRGTGSAQGASGFAAFPASGEGYIVLVDLPPAPAGQTYQAWYLVDGQATSAGLMTVGTDGYAVMSGVDTREGSQQIALTIEPAGGVDAPSGEPVVAGDLSG